MKRREFLRFSAGGLVASPAFALDVRPVPLGVGAAINKAGRQRMLSQRLAKAYAMRLDGVLPDKAGRLLDESRRLFEAQLAELRTLAPTPEIGRALGELDLAWSGYRELLLRPPTPDNARSILAGSERTLRAAHALTGLYEQLAAGGAGHLVNLAGRQRMLSQRIAKCYFFERSALNAAGLRPELATARREFVAALAELNAVPQNDDGIRADLALANLQWMFFEQALDGAEGEPGIAERNVATTSERLLEVMNSLTGRYERLVHA